MVRFLSGRMNFTVMYSMPAFSDLWTSVDGMLVLTSVSTPPLGLSALSARRILYSRMENLCVVLRWVYGCSRRQCFAFGGSTGVQVSLSHSCIPMHDATCFMTGSSALCSRGHQKRTRTAVSRTGWSLLRLRPQRHPTLAAAHQDDTTTI